MIINKKLDNKGIINKISNVLQKYFYNRLLEVSKEDNYKISDI